MADEQKTDEQLKAETEAAAKAKTEFTSEQQAKVQGLIDDAYKRAYSKAQSNSPDIDRLKAELATLKADLAKKNARELDDSIFKEVAKFDVMDISEVTTLLRGNIRPDEDGTPIVVNADGSPRLNLNATPTRPMTIAELITDWLKTRPHHLRASGRQGAGSPGARFGGEGGKEYDLSNPEVIRNMPREDLDKALAGGIEVVGSAGQVFRFKQSGNAFTEARKNRFAKK